MSDEHNGPDDELNRKLTAYLLERKLSRRDLLERIAVVGAAAALTPVLAACGLSRGSAAASAASAPATARPSDTTPPSATPTPPPTPVPTPEAELIVYNWLDYIGKDVIPSFEAKYPVKVKYELFDDIEVAYAKLGQDGSGYDISFPTSVDIPRFREAGTLVKLDKTLIPNIVNLGAEWTDPGYDPGNDYSVPYMWWTTGIAYDTTKIKETLTSSKALWDPKYKKHISVMDDYQETMGMALSSSATP